MSWQTPPEVYAKLHRRYQFDYDAFSDDSNHLCSTYSTTKGTYSNSILISLDDGLKYSWQNLRVFMNPPYSRGLISKCIEKAYIERNNAAIIVMLIPAATDTKWFQDYVLPYCHIDWLPKRIRFINPETGKSGTSPPSGYVIAVFKQEGLT